jgi:hypothetical protein
MGPYLCVSPATADVRTSHWKSFPLGIGPPNAHAASSFSVSLSDPQGTIEEA